MKTIILTITNKIWDQAKQAGVYTQSTLTEGLDEVGFIHAADPGQTMALLDRSFRDQNDMILLLVDIEKIKPEVRYESSSSGRPELFPHIYGPLNLDAIYSSVPLEKDSEGNFIEPAELTKAIDRTSSTTPADRAAHMSDEVYQLVEQQTVNVLESLINGNMTRDEADDWAVKLRGRYGQEYIDQLTDQATPLGELIDAVPLAVTPNGEGGWLYGKQDFKDWLEEYRNTKDR